MGLGSSGCRRHLRRLTALSGIGLACVLLVACGGASADSQPGAPTAARSSASAPSTQVVLASTVAPFAATRPAPTPAAVTGTATQPASVSGLPGGASPTANLQAAVANVVATAAAGLPASGPYACAQKAPAAANGTPNGKVLITVPDIEQAIGFTVNSVVPYSAVAGVLECEYNFDTPAGGAQLKLGIDQNVAQSKADFAAAQTKHVALLDAGCNGCTLTEITPISGLGDSAYQAKRDGDPTDIAVLNGTVYFEIFSLNLKAERLLTMAHAIADHPAS